MRLLLANTVQLLSDDIGRQKSYLVDGCPTLLDNAVWACTYFPTILENIWRLWPIREQWITWVNPGRLSCDYTALSTRCDFYWTTLMFVNIHGACLNILEHSTTLVNNIRQCRTDVRTVRFLLANMSRQKSTNIGQQKSHRVNGAQCVWDTCTLLANVWPCRPGLPTTHNIH